MPGNLFCDQCDKRIGDYSNAYFSNRAKDLDFCSEYCYSKYYQNHNYTYCQASGCLIKLYNSENYCFNHSKYCQHSYCYNRIASSQSCCSSCQEKNQRNQLKSLIRQRTSIPGVIHEVERSIYCRSNCR